MEGDHRFHIDLLELIKLWTGDNTAVAAAATTDDDDDDDDD
eukprot:CAMPEP_0202449404 /NCGR_PEP_ID=MMETSP1360-20130828/8141_1 /ASSEMBLY_ACC=CAM_ASM_000848 /TAXON_ID=515479 /ORGANISM="Licmophora paradoxa, Strain CCMP2313" /LENGTH=40 /DNA_ID= /DNA_START= /DNA_END= /DNA_ORIENTATION=